MYLDSFLFDYSKALARWEVDLNFIARIYRYCQNIALILLNIPMFGFFELFEIDFLFLGLICLLKINAKLSRSLNHNSIFPFIGLIAYLKL